MGATGIAIGTIIRRGILLGIVLVVAACSAVYRNHGYVPTDDTLAMVEVGRDTRDTVADTIGRPGSTGILAESGWYYVGSRWKHYGARAPEEIEREVVAISFDGRGTVANVERFGLERGNVVALSRRVTESNIRGIGFIRQLMGNLGNVRADQFIE